MGLLSSVRSINSLIFSYNLSTTNETRVEFAESKVNKSSHPPPVQPSPPRFGYLVSGSRGDLESLWRVLRTLYHPRNHYVVHLDLESPAEERLELAKRVREDPVFSDVGNVHMIIKANLVTYRGPTMVANTLHACAILLKQSKDWDWFINLSASDYPLVTQDGIYIYILISLVSLSFQIISSWIINAPCLQIWLIHSRGWTGTSTLSTTVAS